MQRSLLVAAVSFGISSCGEAVEERPARSPRPVVAIELTWTDPGVELELTGVVEPWNVEDIAFEVGGRLDFIVEAGSLLQGRWEEGEELIHEGDVLAELDPVPFETALRVTEADVKAARVQYERALPARVKAAQAMLVQQQQEFARTEQAAKTNAVSGLDVIRARAALDSGQASVEQLEAEVEAASATLARAEAMFRGRQLDLENARLFAPFNGEVGEVYVRAGGFVNAGEPVARLVTMNPVLVEVAVSARTNRLIGIDNSARLFLAGRQLDRFGKVYQKSTVADPATRTFSVKIITRNLRLPVNEPADPAVLQLPRVETLMPVVRLDPLDQGPLYAEESCLGEDEQGAFLWRARGVTAETDLSPEDPTFAVEKTRVKLGAGRMNFQKVFVFRELEDAGGLADFDMTAMGVPEGVEDGQRVAVIHETWQLNPGDLVTVRLGRDQGAPGFYVPMESIALDADGRPSVFLIEHEAGGTVARRLDVEVHGSVGTFQRIASEGLEEGKQIVLRGAPYLQDGERVSVTR